MEKINFGSNIFNKIKSDKTSPKNEKISCKNHNAKDEFISSNKAANGAKKNVALSAFGTVLLAACGIFGKRLPKAAKAVMIPTGIASSLGGIVLSLKGGKGNGTNTIEEILPDGTKKTCDIKLNPDGSTLEKGKLIKPDGVVEEYIEHKDKNEHPLYVEKNINHPDGKNYHSKVSLVSNGERIVKTNREVIETDGTKIILENHFADDDFFAKEFELIASPTSICDSADYTRTKIEPNGVQTIKNKTTEYTDDGGSIVNIVKTVKYPNGTQDIEQTKVIDHGTKKIEEKEALFANGEQIKSREETEEFEDYGKMKTETESICQDGSVKNSTKLRDSKNGETETIVTKYPDGKVKEEKIYRALPISNLKTTKSEAKIIYPDKKEENIVKEYEYDDKSNLTKEVTTKTLPDGTQTQEVFEKSYEYNDDGYLVGTVETKTNADGTKEATKTALNYEFGTTKRGVKFPKTKEICTTYSNGTTDTEKVTYEYEADVENSTSKYYPAPTKAVGEKYCADGKVHKFNESYIAADGDHVSFPQSETGITTFPDGGSNEYKIEWSQEAKVEEGVSHFKNGDVKTYKEVYDTHLPDDQKIKEEYTITHPDGTVETSKKVLGALGEMIEVE